MILKDFSVIARQIKKREALGSLGCLWPVLVWPASCCRENFQCESACVRRGGKRKKIPCQYINRGNNFSCQHPGVRIFCFPSVLLLEKSISAYKMCMLNSGICDPFLLLLLFSSSRIKWGAGKVFSDESVPELWFRGWKAAVKLSLYGTGACESCAGPGLTSRLEQTEGNGSPRSPQRAWRGEDCSSWEGGNMRQLSP